MQLVSDVAAHPEAGSVMEGTGGVRKLRWAPEGQGKRGAYRVIYLYHSDTLPVFLLTLYPKGEKDNLTQAEKNEMKKLIPQLVKAYISGREKTLTEKRQHGIQTQSRSS